MLAVRLAPPRSFPAGLANVGPVARAVVAWAAFALAVFAFAETFRGHMRTAGPALLLATLPAAAVAGRMDRCRVLAHLFLVLTAAAGSALLHRTPLSLWGVWFGRGMLLGGVGFVAVGWTPDGLRDRLRALFAHLSANPTGRAAHLFALAGVAAPAVVLFLTDNCPRQGGDTMPVMATIARMWDAGTRDLTPYTAQPRIGRWRGYGYQDPPYNMHPSEYAPGLFSAYPAGMEVFAWPAALVAVAGGAELLDDAVQYRVEYRTAAVVAAFALALFFLTALHVTDAAAAYLLTVMLATGSAFFTTFSHVLWQQTGVVFWMLVVLLVEFRAAGRVGWRGALVQGVACGLMLSCRTTAVTFLVPFGIWVLARDWRRALIIPPVAAAAFVPFAVLYWELHRSLLGPSHIQFAGLRWPTSKAFRGVLVSPSRGLFVYQPVLLLLPVVAWAGWRSRRLADAGYYPFVAVFAGLHVLLAVSWFMWWGGHCHGSRLVSEVVPALALAVAPVVGVLLRTPAGRAALGALALAGFMVHHNAAYYGTNRWHVDPVDVDLKNSRLWSWSRPPFTYIPGYEVGK